MAGCLLLALLSGCSMLGIGGPDSEDYELHPGLVWEQPANRTAAAGDTASPAETDATSAPDDRTVAVLEKGRTPAPEPQTVTSPEPKKLPAPKKAETPKSRNMGAAIEELLSSSALRNGNGILGVYVVNLAEDSAIYQRNAHSSLVPASNMKLFTTAAALEFLTPDYVYETTFEAQGLVTPSGVAGDVVVRGSGDPTISARYHNWDPTAVFKDWARQLKTMGISRIDGDLVGDASYFERFVFCPGWDPEDEPIWYAAQTDALSLNENVIKVFVRPGKRKGHSVSVEIEPETQHVRVENTARTGSRRSGNTLRVTRRCGTNIIEISGQLPSRYKERVRTLTIDDPATYFMDVLARVFEHEGITITGRVRVVRQQGVLPGGRVLLRRTSPPLRELIQETNTESNNFFAEQLLRTVGAHMRGRGTREGGAAVISSWMQELGVPREEFTMIDGSGLSRLNRASPNAVATLLRFMEESPNAAIFKNSLPTSGKEGTLRRRMRGTPAHARVKAKTGYMKGVTSLGGYTDSMDGKPLAFSVIYNGRRPSTSYVKSLEDKLCILLRTHEAGMAKVSPETEDETATAPPATPAPASSSAAPTSLLLPASPAASPPAGMPLLAPAA